VGAFYADGKFYQSIIRTSKVKAKPSFTKPTIEEIKEYGAEVNCNVKGFYDFYQANGWVVGKDKKMACWKAAIRNWKRSSRDQPNAALKSDAQRKADEDLHWKRLGYASEAEYSKGEFDKMMAKLNGANNE